MQWTLVPAPAQDIWNGAQHSGTWERAYLTLKHQNMKRTFTPVLLLSFGVLGAQPTLTVADVMPDMGPTPAIYGVDHVAPGPATANFVFNTGALTLGTGSQSQYVLPSASPYAANFPAATHANTALTNPSLYSYQEINSSGLYLLGLESPDYATIYTDPEKFISLPLSYTNTWSDPWTSSTDYGGSVLVRTATTTGAYNGHGTIVLPWGSFNVMRLQINEVFSDAIDGEEFATGEIATVTYLMPGMSASLFTSNTVTIEIPGAPPNVTNTSSVLDPSAVGMLESALPSLGFTVFPNPAEGSTTVRIGADLKGMVGISVLDMLGREVHQQAVTTNGIAQDVMLDIAGLSAGAYQVVVRSVDGRKGSMPLVVR